MIALDDPKPWEIESRHSGELLRLRKLLLATTGFQLVILECNDPVYRDRLIAQIDRFPITHARLEYSLDFLKFAEFERRLEALCKEHRAVHLVNFEYRPQSRQADGLFQGLNYHRESIAETCAGVLLFWLPSHDIKAFALAAPDMWAWRSAVLDFSVQRERDLPELRSNLDPGSASAPRRDKRIQEILAYLQDSADASRSRAALNFELGELYRDSGRWSDAITCFEQAAKNYQDMDDTREAAMATAQAATIRFEQGNVDQARKELKRALKTFESLGDDRSRAVTMGRIADILQSRGELDEALRIRREEELPVFKRLGDMRSRAVTMGKIADILLVRGELDEALRIRREEELPVYERLGDVRSRAVTLGKIADILVVRGELDEALRIRREEEMPVYERLGDVVSRAATLYKIALILLQQNEEERAFEYLDESYRIMAELGDWQGITQVGFVLGTLLYNKSRKIDAAPILKRCLPGLEQSGQKERAAEVRALLADPEPG